MALRPQLRNIFIIFAISLLSNWSVGKVLLTGKNDVFGGHLTLPKYKIVDCGASCEVIVFYISPKNLLGDFFYSLSVWHHPLARLYA